MATPNWDELENIEDDNSVSIVGDAPLQEVTDDDVTLLQGSVMLGGGSDDSGALEDTLQITDFAGPQLGVRGSAFLGDALKTLAKTPGAKKIAQGTGAIVGGLLGEGLEQSVPHLEGEQVAPLDALSNAAFGQLANKVQSPKGTGFFGTKPMADDIATLGKPEVQAAIRAAKFVDPNIGDMNPTWLSSNTRAAIEGAKAMAANKTQGYGRALGVGRHENPFARNLLKQWTEKVEPVVDERIFKEAQSVPRLGEMAGIAASRIWEDGTSLLQKHSQELSLEPGDILPLLREAAGKVNDLRASSFTTPAANAQSSAILQALQDMEALAQKNGGRLDPISASTMVKNLNKYRREVLQEFDKGTQGKLVQGDVGLKDVEATEALSTISNAINTALNNKVATSKKIPIEEKEILSSFREKYAGYSALEAAAQNFGVKTEAGAAVGDAGKLVGSAGKPESNTDFSRPGLTRKLFDAVFGEPDVPVSPHTSAFQQAQTRNEAGMGAIRDIQTVVESPEIRLPAESASPRDLRLQRLKREAAMTGAGLVAPMAAAATREGLRPDDANAEIHTPLDSYLAPDPFENGLPRDSSAWDDSAIARLLVDSSQSAKAPILQQMAVKFKEAIRSEDQSKSERILADIAKVAPEFFEPGKGVNGRLFHADDQKEYMDKLRHAYRDGAISADFLSRQKKAFADPTNSLILPLELPQDNWRKEKQRGRTADYRRPQGLLGGSYAQIGPAKNNQGSGLSADYSRENIAPGMLPRVGPRY